MSKKLDFGLLKNGDLAPVIQGQSPGIELESITQLLRILFYSQDMTV